MSSHQEVVVQDFVHSRPLELDVQTDNSLIFVLASTPIGIADK